METIDKDLARELMAAKKAPCNFAAVVGSETVLIVAKTAIPPAKVKAAKEKTGGRVLTGRCFDEDGVMVFELEGAPPGGLDKKIREAVKDAAHLSLQVEVRQAKGPDAGVAGNGTAATDGTVDTQAAAFKDRLKALTPGYQAAAKAAPDRKPALDQFVTQAMAAAKAKDYPQGLAHLEQLEAALKGGGATGDATAFRERLKVLTPAYQAAAKATPEHKPALDKIVAQAVAAAKSQDYGAGLAQLEQLEAALQTARPDAASAGAFKDRLKALTADYQAACKAAPDRKAALDNILAQAMAAAKAQDFATGLAHLDQLQEAIEGVRDEEPEVESEPSSGDGSNVAYTKARLAWDQARKSVRSDLQGLEKAILATSAQEPDFEEIRANIGNLYDMLEVLDERLIDTLDDLLNEEAPARRQALRKEAAGLVKEYADYVASDKILQAIDNNGFLDVKVQAMLQTTLSGLRSQLA